MDSRQLARPMRRLLASLAASSSSPSATSSSCSSVSACMPTTQKRSHQIAARNRRALNIAPHASFLPHKQATAPSSALPAGPTEIVHNPPSSEASVYHTPLLFLPKSDPKRRAYLHSIFRNAVASPPQKLRRREPAPSTSEQGTDGSAASSKESGALLPPALKDYAERRYHLTRDQVELIRRLRERRPDTWTINRLAKRFECSPLFISMATRTPAERKAVVDERLDRIRSRWGEKKTAAREDRAKRREMLYRGEL